MRFNMYTKSYNTINGATKGAAVMELLCAAEGPLTRKSIAESVGCTVARVGEVLRALEGSVEKVGGGYVLTNDAALPERTEGRSVSADAAATIEVDEDQLALDLAV
jgi:hypothetical protein